MNLFIDNKSGAPIYEQLYTQIKNQILSGELQPEEAMPSIRGLARDLRISVITTKRAYDELENGGLSVCHPGQRLLRGGEKHGTAPGGESEAN